MATEPRIQLPPGAPGPLLRASGGRHDLEQWKQALREVQGNPLAAAFELARKRRLARIPWLRRQLVPIITLTLVAAIMILLYIEDPSLLPSATQAPWALFLWVGIPLYAIWLLRSIYELALLSLQVLGISGKRAAHLQMDDMLALTPLTGAEIIVGTWWAVARPLLPVALGGAALIWLLGLGMTVEFGDSIFEDLSEVLIVTGFAPLTIACVALSSALTFSALCLWWIAMGRAVKADQLSVGAALIYIFGQLVWFPPTFILISEMGGAGDFAQGGPLESMLYALLAGAVLVFGVYMLLAGAEQNRSVRAGLAVLGPLLPQVVAVIFFGVIIGLWSEQLDLFVGNEFGELVERLVPGLLLSWGGLVPIDPLALPHPALLGFLEDPSSNPYNSAYPTGPGSIWPSPLTYLALLATQAAVLWACARAALRAVELRRRAL